jgi:hypothetical protein
MCEKNIIINYFLKRYFFIKYREKNFLSKVRIYINFVTINAHPFYSKNGIFSEFNIFRIRFLQFIIA